MYAFNRKVQLWLLRSPEDNRAKRGRRRVRVKVRVRVSERRELANVGSLSFSVRTQNTEHRTHLFHSIFGAKHHVFHHLVMCPEIMPLSKNHIQIKETKPEKLLFPLDATPIPE